MLVKKKIGWLNNITNLHLSGEGLIKDKYRLYQIFVFSYIFSHLTNKYLGFTKRIFFYLDLR